MFDMRDQCIPMKYESLAEMFAKQCEKMGSKAIYVFYDRRIKTKKVMSATEIYEVSTATALKVSRCLTSNNSEVGGRIVFLVFNSVIDFIIAFWAVIIAGGVPAPISRKMSADGEWLNKALSHSGAALLMTDVDNLNTNSAIPKLYGSDLEPPDSMHAVTATRMSTDCALLQYSSGSTSVPKPVFLNHGNVLHNLERISQRFSITENDVGASWLPHYHDMGLIGHVMVPLYCGITNHFISPLCFSANPLSWLKLISLTKATISGAPNFAYQYCTRTFLTDSREDAELDLSSWRVAYCGSECISPETLQEFTTIFSTKGFLSQNWYPCYGLAESTLMVSSRKGVHTSALGNSDTRKYVSVGKVNASEVIVKREDGAPCLDWEIGEIYINSPSVALNLQQDWLNTGDVGFLLNDELYIVGRKFNITKYHGEKVYLEEVENLLDRSLEKIGIKRCLLMAINHVNYQYVLLSESGCKNSQPDVKEIRGIATPVIARFLGDSRYESLCVRKGKLPLTSSGKPDRKATANFIEKSITQTEIENES